MDPTEQRPAVSSQAASDLEDQVLPRPARSAVLELANLKVVRGEGRQRQTALRVDRLEIHEGEILAVIGPNGSGKSTLLLSLSRLIEPATGEILFRGETLNARNDLAYRREIAMVLQDPLLLDLSVAENVALGMRFRKWPKAKVQERVSHWLARLGIAELKNRRAAQLSGGEAQRTSIARALALEPGVLFLDEPFGSLDRPTRLALIEDLQVLLAETQATTVFVTHDLDEALALGSRVAVLLDGTIRQVGRPDLVFSTPADPEVAAFVGVETFLPGTITGNVNGLLEVAAGAFVLEIAGEAPPGQKVLVCMRPEDLTIWQTREVPPSSARNVLRGRIQRISHQAMFSKVLVDCGFPVAAKITRASAADMQLKEGQEVALSFKATSVHLISRR